jgi:hypothetical protein
MNDSQELKINLVVTVNSDGIEHELDVNTEGYTASNTRDIQDIINEDIDYLVEDLRRRVTIIK